MEANEQIQDIQNMNTATTPNLEESIPIIVGGGESTSSSSSSADFLTNKRQPLESPTSSNDNDNEFEYSIDTEIELQQFIQHINTIDR